MSIGRPAAACLRDNFAHQYRKLHRVRDRWSETHLEVLVSKFRSALTLGGTITSRDVERTCNASTLGCVTLLYSGPNEA